MRDPIERVCRLLRWQVWLQLFAICILLLLVGKAWGHDHYTTWIRPDSKTSCCNQNDCYPTAAKWSGKWIAQRREDGKWLPVPQETVLEGMSPDGKAHLCAPRPGAGWEEDKVFCFAPPNAGS